MLRFLVCLQIALVILTNSAHGQNLSDQRRANVAADPYKPFAAAIDAMDAALVTKALDEGADPNARYQSKGRFVLDMVVGQLMLPTYKSDDANSKFTSKEQFETAVIEVCDVLIKRGAKLERIKGILIAPALENSIRVSEYLLKQGANPNDTENDNISPLYVAVSNKFDELEKLLLAHGATRFSDHERIQIQITGASKRGNSGQLKSLVDAGGNINEPDVSGQVALISAISARRWVTALRLLDMGADPGVPGNGAVFRKTTALHIVTFEACIRKKKSGWDDEELVDYLFDRLLDKGAPVSSAQHYNNQTPLHIAAKSGSTEVAQNLIKHGAKLMPKDREGKTPLDLAEAGPMIKMLKECGAKEQ